MTMPCRDITEKLKIKLDAENRLADYHLTKSTCGSAVGTDTLLLEKLTGEAAETIIRLSPSSLLNMLQIEDSTELFLYRKHLSALQIGLEILTGQRDSNFSKRFVIEKITSGTDGTKLIARVKLAVPTENIEPCEYCGQRVGKDSPRF